MWFPHVCNSVVPTRLQQCDSLTRLLAINTVRLVGSANLSSDYFDRRQDRYFLIRAAPELTDFFHDIVTAVSRHSLVLRSDDTTAMHCTALQHPYTVREESDDTSTLRLPYTVGDDITTLHLPCKVGDDTTALHHPCMVGDDTTALHHPCILGDDTTACTFLTRWVMTPRHCTSLVRWVMTPQHCTSLARWVMTPQHCTFLTH